MTDALLLFIVQQVHRDGTGVRLPASELFLIVDWTIMSVLGTSAAK